MEKHENMLFYEYKMLRKEIMTIPTRRNICSNFTITSVITILVFTLSTDFPNSTYLTLLPFAVLLPKTFRIVYDSREMIRICLK